MSTILKNNFRLRNAKDFIENFRGHPRLTAPSYPLSANNKEELLEEIGTHVVDRNHYIFVGRSRPWEIDNTVNPPLNDLNPRSPLDTLSDEAEIWDAMLGLKRIDYAWVSLVVPRHDWDASGDTIYAQYDDKDSELFNRPTDNDISDADLNSYTAGSFYVLTDEFHVFKCLSNNNRAKSTSKPLKPTSAPYIFEGSDGYRWKYLTTITPAQAVRFLTDQWMPVKTLGNIPNDGSTQWQVEQTATGNSIDSFIVENKGVGYAAVLDDTLVAATANTVTLSAAASPVDNYYVGYTIHITAGTGFPQAPKVITAYNGTTKVATLANNWTVIPDSSTEIQIRPTITVSGNGSGLIAKAEVETAPGPNQYKVVGVTILNAGTGYTYASASVTSGSVGTGALVRPVIAPINGHGGDIERELNGIYVMLVTRLSYNEGDGDFPIANDYRQIGLIRDIRDANGDLSNANTRMASSKLLVDSVTPGIGGNFAPDEDIVGVLGQNVAVGKLLQYTETSPGEGELAFIQDNITGHAQFLDGMTISGSISGASATVKVTGVVGPEILKYSGDILAVEHRRPILRANDLIEDIRIVVKF